MVGIQVGEFSNEYWERWDFIPVSLTSLASTPPRQIEPGERVVVDTIEKFWGTTLDPEFASGSEASYLNFMEFLETTRAPKMRDHQWVVRVILNEGTTITTFASTTAIQLLYREYRAFRLTNAAAEGSLDQYKPNGEPMGSFALVPFRYLRCAYASRITHPGNTEPVNPKSR